jgi:inorganic triphosphatase YgiF
LEIKFALTGEQFERIKALPALRGLAAGEPVQQSLRSIYFDTPDCSLHQHGYALRLRQVGKVWLQTVKADAGVHGGVSNPVEIETEAKGRRVQLDLISDSNVRRDLRRLIGNQPPVPVFETIIERTVQPLATAGGCEFELALDKGIVKAGRRSLEICEAELELKHGTAEDLYQVVTQLFAGESLTPSGQNKSELGYRLRGRTPEIGPVPRKARLPLLHRKDACAFAVEQICRAAVGQILHNWQVVLASDDPEGPHQMRIGIRRLRSALAVFRPLLKKKLLRDLEQQLRELARLIGELRDVDVMQADIVGPLDGRNGKSPDLAPLRELLETRRAAVRARVRQDLAGPGPTTLQVRLALLPSVLADPAGGKRRAALRVPVTRLAAAALQKRWQKVANRARHLEELSDEERHALRKDLKTLRYTAEFFAPLFAAGKVRKFIAELQHLQELFGYLNDVVMAGRLAELTGPKSESVGLREAVGYVMGWHSAHAEDAWRDARTRWRELKKARRFWQ